jgi:hypothetical protein
MTDTDAVKLCENAIVICSSVVQPVRPKGLLKFTGFAEPLVEFI